MLSMVEKMKVMMMKVQWGCDEAVWGVLLMGIRRTDICDCRVAFATESINCFENQELFHCWNQIQFWIQIELNSNEYRIEIVVYFLFQVE